MANRYPLILNAAAGQLQELPTGDSLDLGGESILGVKLGSQGVPSISFTGDTNTGIYSPSADQLAISTGGTGRLFVDASGRLGLGRSNPSFVLDVQAGAGDGIRYTNSVNSVENILGADSSTGQLGTTTAHPVAFLVGSIERMRVDTSGRLGLGTSSPTNKFTIKQHNDADSTVGTAIEANGNDNRLLTYFNTAQDAWITTASYGSTGAFKAMSFWTSDTRRLTIATGGNVGIGTTSPESLLHLNGDVTAFRITRGSAIGFLYNTGTATTDPFRIQSNGGPVDIYTAASQPITFTTGTTERMRITSAGLLGLGTSAPEVKLEIRDSIAGGSDGTIATLHNFSDTGADTRYSGLNFRIGSDNGTSAIRAFRTAGAIDYRTDLSFWTNPTGFTQTPVRAMTIDYLQRVGIGTTIPTDAQLYVNSSFIYGVRINHATNPLQSFLVNGTQAFTIGANSGGGGNFYYGTGNLEAARIDSSGRLLVGTSSSFAGGLFCIGSGQGGNPPSGEHIKIAPSANRIEFLDSSSNASDTGSVSLWNTVYNNRSANIKLFHPASNTGAIAFETHDGTSLTERMRINSSGQILAGALGTAALPIISFLNDPNTGIFSPGADQLAISTNGVARLTTSTTAVSSSLAIDHPLGAVATPSITFTGDLNTGFYSPAADTLAAVTAGQNRLHITSGGLVGLGTSSPTNTAGFSQQLQLTGNLPCISIDNTGTGANKYSLGVNSAGALGFWDNTASAYRMYIDSSGNVGIGTTSPNASCKLSVSNGGAEGIELRPGTSTAGEGDILFYNRSTNAYLTANYLANVHVWSGGGGERARIDSSGRLGLGTSSPTTGKLHIYILNNNATPNAISTEIAAVAYPGTDNMSAGKFVNNALGATAYGIWAETTDTGFGIRYAGYFKCAGHIYGSSYGLYAENTQPNVGGGGAAYAGYFKALSAGTGTSGSIYGLRVENTAAVGGTSYGALISTVSGPSTVIPFAVEHAGSERLRIDSSGRLLVGTSSTIGNVRAVFSGWGSNPTQQGIVRIQRGSLPTSGQTIADVEFADDSNNLGAGLTAVAEANWASGTSHPSRLVFSTTADGAASPTERMRINSSGQILAGALGTAALPIISFLNDPNTGIYSPGADQVAISTNGTEKLIVKSDGKVGIGTSGPDANSMITVLNATTASYRAQNNVGGAAIFGVSDSASSEGFINASNAFRFKVDGTTRASLTATGLGIGTTGPTAPLEVFATNAGVRVTSSNTGTSYINMGDTDSANIGGFEYYHTTNNLAFIVNQNEAFRVDSSGRLLVGTSSERTNVYYTTVATTPKVQFETVGSTYNNGLSLLHYSSTGYAPILTLGSSSSATQGTQVALSNDFPLGAIQFVGSDGTNFRTGASIVATNDQAASWAVGDCPTRLVFSTTADGAASPTERVRIKSDGVTSFGQGATGPGSGVAGTLINAGEGGILITNDTTPFLRCYTLSGGFPTALQIAANGNVTNANNSYGAISDIKLKENIVDAKSQWNDLKAFQVRNYNLKEGETHTQIGLIAQEVELVSPGIVTEFLDRDEDGNDLGTVTKSVNYSVLCMKAVKALQEAMERIETLEASNADLLARVTALEAA